MGWPSKMTVPADGLSWPHMQLNSVVLPAPFGPTSPTASPAATDSDTSRNAANPPKLIDTPLASSRHGVPGGDAGGPAAVSVSDTDTLTGGDGRRGHGLERGAHPGDGAHRSFHHTTPA